MPVVIDVTSFSGRGAAMDVGPVNNVILLADGYKVTHYRHYPPGTTLLYSYFESRGGKFPYTCFFGLQYILKRWLVGPVVTRQAILEAKEVHSSMYKNDEDFNEEGWSYILETLLVQVWYPTTVATISRVYKQILHHYLSLTNDNLLQLESSLHDCGYRGVSSIESGAIGGAANMIHFKITGTVAGLCLLRKYYHLKTPWGYADPCSEHSSVTSWGRHREADAYTHMLNTYPGRPVSCVIDSYDMYKCLKEIICGQLKDLVKEHGQKGGVLTVRPDSDDPATAVLKCLEILGQHFGTEINNKGYKMLPSFLQVFHSDGINIQSLVNILRTTERHGWSTGNFKLGAGSSLLQKINRDILNFAFKCSFAVVDGREREVYKQPMTDTGKNSKKGRLTLQSHNKNYITIEHGKGDPEKDLLVPVFENGKLLHDYRFEEIRQRAQITPDDIDILQFLTADK
ncbi:nicotinamide phosphoribosyltransferase isoform X2 [Cherax quadricarinatus]|uniref:nicotinamide phosphoribosyltransferase isoform X2 n=1 Tax=Cherax quadricarinatus TaxID=27406 RepID=UPI00387ED77A